MSRDLYEHTDLFLAERIVVLNPPKSRCARGRRETAHSTGRVPGRSDGLPCFTLGLNIRYKEALHSDIEESFDCDRIVVS